MATTKLISRPFVEVRTLDDNAFVLAADGWVQICPLGEFKHVGAGVTQVIDREACDAMAAGYRVKALEATDGDALLRGQGMTEGSPILVNNSASFVSLYLAARRAASRFAASVPLFFL